MELASWYHLMRGWASTRGCGGGHTLIQVKAATRYLRYHTAVDP